MTTTTQIEANRRNALASTGPTTAAWKAASRLNAVRHGILSRLDVLPGLEQPEDWREHLTAVVTDLDPVRYLELVLAERVALMLWRLGRVARFERESAAVELENVETDAANYGENLAAARGSVETAQSRIALADTLEGQADSAPVDPALAARLLTDIAELVGVGIFDNSPYRPLVTFPDYPDGAALEDVAWDAGYLKRCIDVIVKAAKTDRITLLRAVADSYREARESAIAKLADLERRIDQKRRKRIIPEAETLDKVTRYESALERGLYKALHELQRLQASRSGAAVPPPVVVDVTVDGHSEAA